MLRPPFESRQERKERGSKAPGAASPGTGEASIRELQLTNDAPNVKPARTTSGGAACRAATIGWGSGGGNASSSGGGSNAADDCLPPPAAEEVEEPSRRRLPSRRNLFLRPPSRWNLFHRPLCSRLQPASRWRRGRLRRPLRVRHLLEAVLKHRFDSAPERAESSTREEDVREKNNNILPAGCRERKRLSLLSWGRGPKKEGTNFP